MGLIEKLYGFFAPGGYADEHIAHYTRAELIERFEATASRTRPRATSCAAS